MGGGEGARPGSFIMGGGAFAGALALVTPALPRRNTIHQPSLNCEHAVPLKGGDHRGAHQGGSPGAWCAFRTRVPHCHWLLTPSSECPLVVSPSLEPSTSASHGSPHVALHHRHQPPVGRSVVLTPSKTPRLAFGMVCPIWFLCVGVACGGPKESGQWAYHNNVFRGISRTQYSGRCTPRPCACR